MLEERFYEIHRVFWEHIGGGEVPKIASILDKHFKSCSILDIHFKSCFSPPLFHEYLHTMAVEPAKKS